MALPVGGRVAHLNGTLELPGAAVAAVTHGKEMQGGKLAAPLVTGMPGATFVERIRRVPRRRHPEASGGGTSARGPEAGAAVAATVDHTLGALGKWCDMQGRG